MAKPILDDELWELIEPLIPVKPRRRHHPGRKPVERRKVLTGILFVLRTGIPWEYLPREMGCGSGVTCWRRLQEWQDAGVWDKIHELLLAKLRANEAIDLSVAAVDSSSVRAVGGAKKPAQTRRIGANAVASTMLLPTPTASRSRARSRARMSMTALNSCH